MPYDFIYDIRYRSYIFLSSFIMIAISRSHAFSIRVADTVRQFRPIEPVTTRDAGDRFRENITTSFLCHPNPIVRSLLYRAIHFRPTSNRGYPQEIENPPLPLYLVKLFAPNLLRYISRNYTNYFQMYFNAIQIFSKLFQNSTHISIAFSNNFSSQTIFLLCRDINTHINSHAFRRWLSPSSFSLSLAQFARSTVSSKADN